MALTITPQQLFSNLQKREPLLLLDIRNADEFSRWNLFGSINLPFDKIWKKYREISKKEKIAVVCNRGNDSVKAAKYLQNKGYEAFSLEGGLKAWNFIYDIVEIDENNIQDLSIFQFKRLGKGCLTYLFSDRKSGQSLLIDPTLDIEVFASFIKKNKYKVQAVVDTHIHADHLSGGRQLAKKWGIPYLIPQKSRVKFKALSIEKQLPKLLSRKIEILATPGHTPEGVSLAIEQYVFTGDTLFVDTFGRTDLADSNGHRHGQDLFNSVKNILYNLGDNFYVLPAHSAQPMVPGPVRSATLRYVKRFNLLNKDTEYEEYLEMVKRVDPPPSNYRIIKEINVSGRIPHKFDRQELEFGGSFCNVRPSDSVFS